jgi:polysaccharide biosynthesis/export protein
MIRIWLIFFIAGLFLSSCVPNKRYTLLQKKGVNEREMAKDTILRSYDLQLSNYRIQPQDQLSINVATMTPDQYNFIKELNPTQNAGAGGMNMMLSGYFVNNGGDVSFPVIGDVKLAGLTVFEAEDKIEGLLQPMLRDPIVKVRLLNFRFTFLGEINTQVTSFNPRISIAEAIALAGGLTELSDRENIKVIRQRGNQADIYYVNMLREEFISSPYFYLQQNDIVIIPPLKQRTFKLYWGQSLGLFTSTLSIILLIANLNK